MNIRLVTQEDANGCGIACIAMVRGVTYAEAKRLFHERYWGDYSFHNDGMAAVLLDAVLADAGFAVQRLYRNVNDPQWHRPFAPVHICRVTSAVHDHFVVMTEDGTVLDPSQYPPRRLSDYPLIRDVAGLYKV